MEDTTSNEENSGFEGLLKGETTPRRIRTDCWWLDPQRRRGLTGEHGHLVAYGSDGCLHHPHCSFASARIDRSQQAAGRGPVSALGHAVYEY